MEMAKHPSCSSKQQDWAQVLEIDNKVEEDQRPCTTLQIPTSTPTTTQEAEATAIASISISMPTTPSGHSSLTVGVADNSDSATDDVSKAKLYSPAMARTVARIDYSSGTNAQVRNPALHRLRDHRFDSFKTWSGKLERQLSHLRGVHVDELPEEIMPHTSEENEALPVHRYFDALEGPELDTLRPSEELMLPEDSKWPFLLRFPIASFGMCLGVSSQALLWKALASTPSLSFLHVSHTVNMVLWCISIVVVVIVSLIYAMKLIFYFEAVRREYYHPIRVNFFFAPFIALLFLAQGVPHSHFKHLPHALWYVLMAPFFCFELKIYGQWMSGGERRLSKVANPSNHLSIIGNFVGALLGASMGLKEGPLFFFAVGLAHYTVLFVTLYQRLPTNDTLPKDLHPVFFLFIAPPSVISMAWATIQGSFDNGAKLAYFISLFLYFSLVVRVNFFRGIRFSLAWWAYTFPMTGAAIATITYSNVVTNWVTRSLAILLSGVATVVVTGLLLTTLFHAFVLKNLFPNDIAIAISGKPPKFRKRWFPLIGNGSSDTKHTDNYLKFVHPEPQTQSNDSESSTENSSQNGQNQV